MIDSPHPLVQIAPEVRFPVTICVLAFGPHADLAERFLSSLYKYTDCRLFSLRAGLNEVEPATCALFDAYASRYGNVELFVEPKNRFKSPVMRRLFHERSLESEWTVWCDDDTHFTRADWLHRLAAKIVSDSRVSVWGDMRQVCVEEEEILDWMTAAKWHRGLPPILRRNEEGRQVFEIVFPVGGFWAARTQTIQDLEWPDPRLIHAHEDFVLGEAMRQNEFRLAPFRYGVAINDAIRRNAGAPEVRGLVPSV